MQDWDDIRYFLAVTRAPSLRLAALSLGISRSTILRRITALEAGMGVRLFDRRATGYLTTQAGEELMETACEMERLALDAGRRLLGQDSKLSGSIKVALSAALIAGPLVDELSKFVKLHPDIRLELLTSYGMANLFRREADVAIRISNDPPDELVGRRVLTVARSCFAASNCIQNGRLNADQKWIGWSTGSDAAHWYEEAEYPNIEMGAIIDDPFATLEAVRAGMGVAILPCFMGDQVEGVCRIPPGKLLLKQDMWILTHRDLRKTARIRVFTDFITKAILRNKEMYEGKLIAG